MEQKQTRVTFEDVESGKNIIVTITPSEDDLNVVVDFGKDGMDADDEGLYIGMCNVFLDTVLGVFNEEDEEV